MEYELVILFEKQDLSLINKAREKVVLVQATHETNYPVVWAAFTPFERNLVTWNNQYFLYASTSLPTPDREILIVAEQKAQSQNIYTFNQDRTFSDPESEPSLNLNQYMVVNNLPYEQMPSLTFGLAQSCTINSLTKSSNINSQGIKPLPIHAAIVPSKQFAKFIPRKELFILLASNTTTSMVCGIGGLGENEGDRLRISANNGTSERVESFATKLDFRRQHQIAVKYDAPEGKFSQKSLLL